MSAIPYATFEQDFKVQKMLGKGNCATVSQVYHHIDKQYYAHKRIVVSSLEQLTNSINQIEVIRHIGDDKATKIYYYYTYQNPQNGNYELGLIMELCGANLTQLIKSRKKKKLFFKTQDLRDFLSSLVPFFAKMQKKNIFHRDIKPDNILLAKTKKVEYRVADFGFSIMKNTYSKRNIAGTLEYVSPKLKVKFKNNKIQVPGHTIKDDVYSFGKTLLEMMTLDNSSEITQKKINECRERYGKQYTNIIQITTQTNEQKRVDFITLQNILLQNKMISLNEQTSNNLSLGKSRNKSLSGSYHTVQFHKFRENDTKSNYDSTIPFTTKHKRKPNEDNVTTLVKIQKVSQKTTNQVVKKWEKKVISQKQQILCMQQCENLLFLGMQNTIGIFIIATKKLIKFCHPQSFKDITCMKVTQDQQILVLGTLNCKVLCIPILQLKKLMVSSTDSFRIQNSNSIIVKIDGLKCTEYTLAAPISAFDIFPTDTKQVGLIVGHHTGQITVIANNKQERKTAFLNEPITFLQIRDEIVYTSFAHGLFKRQTANSFGIVINKSNCKQIPSINNTKEKMMKISSHQIYKCDSPILNFSIITHCKKNEKIVKEENQYLALIVTFEGMIHIISKSMKCERIVRISEFNILAAYNKINYDRELGIEGYYINSEGQMISEEGILVQNLGEKDLVCLVPTESYIFCGGFNKKIVILSSQDSTTNFKE